MACTALEQDRDKTNISWVQWAGSLFARLAGVVSRAPRLDLDVIPDRVKRDLGFMDGRDPRYEFELWR
jgi:hypothetical protein